MTEQDSYLINLQRAACKKAKIHLPLKEGQAITYQQFQDFVDVLIQGMRELLRKETQ